jgi:hypothetical protein
MACSACIKLIMDSDSNTNAVLSDLQLNEALDKDSSNLLRGISMLLTKHVDPLKKEMEGIREMIAPLNEAVNKHTDLINTHTLQITNIERSLEEIAKKVENTTVAGNNVEDLLVEANSRLERSNNIILYNVMELPSSNTDGSTSFNDFTLQLENQDLHLAKKVLSKFSDKINIIYTKRIGKKTDGKHRPILVRLHSKEQVLYILRNKSLLPGNVNASSDQTQMQRDYFKNLKKTCDAHNSNYPNDKKKIIFVKSIPKIVDMKDNSKN